MCRCSSATGSAPRTALDPVASAAGDGTGGDAVTEPQAATSAYAAPTGATDDRSVGPPAAPMTLPPLIVPYDVMVVDPDLLWRVETMNGFSHMMVKDTVTVLGAC